MSFLGCDIIVEKVDFRAVFSGLDNKFSPKWFLFFYLSEKSFLTNHCSVYCDEKELPPADGNLAGAQPRALKYTVETEIVWILQMTFVLKQILVVLKTLRKYCSCRTFWVITWGISVGLFLSEFSVFVVALPKAQLTVAVVWPKETGLCVWQLPVSARNWDTLLLLSPVTAGTQTVP